jgi:hypothetical protein
VGSAAAKPIIAPIIFQLIDVDLLLVVEEAATANACGQWDDALKPRFLTMKSKAFVRSVAFSVGKGVARDQVVDGSLPGVVRSNAECALSDLTPSVRCPMDEISL